MSNVRTAGIIAEYNPITNGHVYHLEKTREMSRADFVVVVMSGDFTQRGRPAIIDKWTRSRLAVGCGADLVLELPFVYATGSAEMFASGGVGILEGLGIVDTLSFGSESGDICKLARIADLLKDEPAEFKETLKKHLQTGVSFPKARQLAVGETIGEELSKLLESPNNILAIEYLKQIRTLEPVTVKRMGEYNDATIPEMMQTGAFASASAVRMAAGEGRFEELAGAVPGKCLEAMKSVFCESTDNECAEKTITSIINADKEILKKGDSKDRYFDLLRAVILRSPEEELRQISGVSEGIENRLKREIRNHSSYDSYAEAVKSKRFTRTAIDRMLLHILIGLSSEDSDICRLPLYARVLAFNDNGAQLIRRAKSISKIPIITNINKEMPEDHLLQRIIEYDIHAGDIYNILRGADLYKSSDYVIRPFY